LDDDGAVYPTLILHDETNKQFKTTITNIIDDLHVQVELETETELPNGDIYLYGQTVDNFNSISKSNIFTITTAALQEVDRQLQAEKNKVIALQTQITDILARLEYVEAIV
jgi:hypothetical protein